MPKKKILITGGLGYLGSSLSRYFFDKGYDIRVLAHNKPPHQHKGYTKCEIIFGDILKKEVLEKACKGVDFVIHLAGLNYQECKENPGMALQVNGIGTRNLLEAAGNANVERFVYASTFHVYGKPIGNVSEEIPPKPLSDYAKTKLIGENYCMHFKGRMKCMIVRISNAYGPSGSPEPALAANDFCMQAIKNQKIVLRNDGMEKRDFISINDAGQAISLLLTVNPKKLKEKVFNLGGNNLLSIRELAELISRTYMEIYGKKVKMEFGKSLGNNPINFTFDISRIRKLGYAPKADMKKEIAKTFKALKGEDIG